MIYAIHKRTKEHRLAQPDWAFAGDWERVEADAEGWIPHDGRDCPLPDGAKYDARTRSGKTVPCCEACITQRWDYTVAYRPVLEAKPEAPEWDGEGELPPINHKCEMAREGEKYSPGALRYIGNALVVWEFESGSEIALRPEHCDFRPIRSEEEKQIEAIAKATGLRGRDGRDEVARNLYAAGCRMTKQ